MLSQQSIDHWPLPFRSLSEALEKLDLPSKRYGHWRLTEYQLGSINGLPNSYGRLVATDGIMCLILTSKRKVFEGHVQWFVPEDSFEFESNQAGKQLTLEDIV